eukprot:6485016-Amphidinium_carterae.1
MNREYTNLECRVTFGTPSALSRTLFVSAARPTLDAQSKVEKILTLSASLHAMGRGWRSTSTAGTTKGNGPQYALEDRYKRSEGS